MANSLAFVDRQALALLVEPIKHDLHVSDTMISLLFGLSFTIFFVLAGLPIARLADRSNRRNLIATAIFFWSLMTVACGLARSFWALFVSRVGVGAGEAGLGPSAYSILADYFPPERLAAAMGLYSVGIYVGGGLALLVGGWIAGSIAHVGPVVLPLIGPFHTWQLVFFGLGAPGLLVSLVSLTIREPERRGEVAARETPPLGQVIAHMLTRWRAYLGITLGFALLIMVGNGSSAWAPAFFARKFGWSMAEIGIRYGSVVFLFGTAGALAGGYFASWLRRRGHARANLTAVFIGFCGFAPLAIGFPLADTPSLALGLVAVLNFFGGFNFGGGFAALQDITPNRMRATVSSFYALAVNLIGSGLGPTVVALVTDFVFHDPNQLPAALAVIALIACPVAVLLIGVARSDYRTVTPRPGAA